jgi:D-alanyl-D-alanine carboxypeptidase
MRKMRPVPFPVRAALLAVSLTALPAHAQAPNPDPAPPEFPATYAGSLGRAVVDAINDPDTVAITLFLSSSLAAEPNQPRAEVEAMLRGIRAQGAPVTPRSVRQTQDGALVMALMAHGHPAGVVLRLAPAAGDSSRLDRLNLVRNLRPGDEFRPLPRERLPEDEMLRRVEEELRRLEALDRLSGVVLIGRGDHILYEATFGRENPETGARMTTRSRFHTASVPKMFTAVAIGQLVEAGRLSFDDTLGELLPGLPWTEPARAITVHQLLTHRSGMPFAPAGPEPATSLGQAARFAGLPLQFAPGTQMQYSNEGFITLAAVVEELSGQTFDAYMAEHVLRPAGIRTMHFAPAADSLVDRAMPSPLRDGDLFGVMPRQAKSQGFGGGGAGGSHASARDLFAFTRALLAGRLVRPETLQALLTPRRPWDGGEEYGYGFILREANGRRLAGHRGGGPRGMGLCNDMSFFLDGTYTVIVLTNYDAPFCATVKQEIVEMLARN